MVHCRDPILFPVALIYVAVAVERVGDEVEAGEAGELVEGAGGHTADLVAEQVQLLEVAEALEHGAVDAADLVFGQFAGRTR